MLLTLGVLPPVEADTPGLLIMCRVGVLGVVRAARPAMLGAVALAAVTVATVALSPLAQVLASWWVRDDPWSSGVDAAIVLSGGLNPDSTISSDALDKLVSGLELVRSGRVCLIVNTKARAIS